MRRILAIAAAAGVIMAAAPLWADSAAQSGNAADFLDGVNCPNPVTSTTPCFNPNASGTKFSGTLTVVYGKTVGSCVYGVFVGLTLQQGNAGPVPFTTDLLFDPCLPNVAEAENDVVRLLIDLVRVKVIPTFYACVQPSCPSFQVKSISDFVSTTGPLSDGTSEGFSADVTIAVR